MTRLLRPVIVIAVLLGSFIFGQQASRSLILLILLGISAIVLLRHPLLVIFPLVIGSMLVGFEIGTGTQSTINVTILMVIGMIGLWILDTLVNRQRYFLYPSQVNPPLIAFCLVALISFIAGQLPWFAFAHPVSITAQIAGLSLFFLSAGAFLWASQAIKDLKLLRWLVWLYIGSGAIYVLANFIPLGLLSQSFVSSAAGSLFWIWLVVLASSQALFNKQLSKEWRSLLGIITILALLRGWINRDWVSGWLPAAIAFLVVLVCWNWRLGLILGIASILIVFVINPELLQSMLVIDQYSIFTRQEAWRIVINDIVKISPLIGLGPANYYNYTQLFPILGYAIRFNSHNQYLDLLAQTGFIGLFVFTWLIAEIGLLAWRLKDSFPSGFEKAYVIGVLGGLVGTLAAGMLGDWFIPFVYNIGLAGFRSSVFGWIFLGGLVSIQRLAYQTENLSTTS